MAETLAVAASGIAVAQITGSVGLAVVRLRSLLQKVKDVPNDVADLLQQLECLDPALWEAESILDDHPLPPPIWNDPSSRRGIMYCRTALAMISPIIEELDSRINRQKGLVGKFTAVRIILRKDFLQRLQMTLSRVIGMLSLAQQSYLIALTRAQPDVIIHKFRALSSEQNESLPSESTSRNRKFTPSDQLQKTPRNRASVKRFSDLVNEATRAQYCDRRKHLYRLRTFGGLFRVPTASGCHIFLQTPSWLAWRAWELQSYRAAGLWQCSIRSYSIRPCGSEVFHTAYFGTVEQLQYLFQSRLASPLDRNEDGITLLQAAAQTPNIGVIECLFSLGIDPFETCRQSDARRVLTYDSHLSPHSTSLRLLEELILEGSDFDSDSNCQSTPVDCQCVDGYGDLPVYNERRQARCPSHTESTLESRLYTAHHIAVRGGLAAVAMAVLEPDWQKDPRACCQLSLSSDDPLIHTTALGIAANYVQELVDTSTANQPSRLWSKFAVEVIRQTSDVHCPHPLFRRRYDYYWTALHGLLRHFVFNFQQKSVFSRSRRLLRMWLRSCKEAGIDLEAYGRNEMKILAEFASARECNDAILTHRPGTSKEFRNGESRLMYLIGFKYGPEIADWEIYWAEPTDAFAGEFWELVEDRPLHIPGAWVDD